jgi:protoheme IX farnesyltransferase
LIKDYYRLVKPGIIYGNLVTTIAGFIFGSHANIGYINLIMTILGISFVIASGCVLNNIFDRDIDAIMNRTKYRELVLGKIDLRHALVYAITLGVLGFVLLIINTNLLTVIIAFIGLFFYVCLYTLYFKRHSVHGTFIGSISGAVPILVGYTATTNSFGLCGFILLLILSFWQMPHSYAINIRLINDYKNANINVMPVIYGIGFTKVLMFFYVILFSLAIISLYYYGFVGKIYLCGMLILCFFWFLLSILSIFSHNDKKFATINFIFSIITIMSFSILLIIDTCYLYGLYIK